MADTTGTTHSTTRKVLKGVVRSDKMDKTVVVEVSRRVMHRMYKKYITKRERYKAHDENNKFRVGDTVEIIECRPISRDKRWRVMALVVRQA